MVEPLQPIPGNLHSTCEVFLARLQIVPDPGPQAQAQRGSDVREFRIFGHMVISVAAVLPEQGFHLLAQKH